MTHGQYPSHMKVSDVLRMLHDDGWTLVATRGSHRQFKHGIKAGRVTVPGKPYAHEPRRHMKFTLAEVPDLQEGLAYGGTADEAMANVEVPALSILAERAFADGRSLWQN